MSSDKKQISIRLPIKLIDRIEKLAKQENRNRSNMIRCLLKKLFDKKEEIKV